jgi:universal stress protein A
MLPVKRILCPTDFSEPSYEGLKAANELAEHFSAELCLVHVVAPVPMPMAQAPAVPEAFNVASYRTELEASAQRSLHEVVEQKLPKELRVRQIIGHGEAASEIVRIAEEETVDLIVIATHGLTGWRHLIFGSVAEKVVRLATAPVLTIRVSEKEK